MDDIGENGRRLLWSFGALDRGRIGVFYAFKMPKTHLR
jgi:hypothetical protein